MKGKLIVLEGTDASGKSTQFELLCRKLDTLNLPYKSVVFPRYEQPSSVLLKMYLNGEFGKNPGDVSAYAASLLFAVDRLASYKKEWGEFYNNGGIVICDRYTTSNAIHQSAKLSPDERRAFCDWLFNLEYNLMELPAPERVLFLDMPSECAIRLLNERVSKKKDIHEKDTSYLKQCREAAMQICDTYNWVKVKCTENNSEISTREAVHERIMSAISDIITQQKGELS